jgi:uncharacterized protein YgbK (DUF1537 family)
VRALLALADDLTGAHGLAGRWAGRGAPVWVARGAGALRGLPGSRVLSVETRFLGADAARAAVLRGWGQLAPAGALCYQKIDSTLRGNPGAEIEGLLLATGAPWVAVLPAYPELGRQVLGGAVHVHGRRLDRSEYASDPLSPARQWRVAGLFPARLGAHAPLRTVAGPAAGLRAWIRRSRGRGARFLSFDCAEGRQVHAIAGACLAEGGRHYAGAADLGGALARRLNGPARPARPPRGLPWCILAGSVSASTFAQLAWAAERGRLAWTPRLGRRGAGWRVARAGRGAADALRVFGALAFSSLACRADLAPWLADQARRGRTRAAAAAEALQGLVDLGAASAGGLDRAAWFLTGGHTLATFFDRHGLARCRVDGELLREAPWGLAEGPGSRAWVCSKPGGFGPVDFFGRLLEASQ